MMPVWGEDAPVVEIHDKDGPLGTIANVDGVLTGSNPVLEQLARRLMAIHGAGAWDYLLALDNGYMQARAAP